MPRKKILVTGADGQLGSEIRGLINEYSQFEFLFVNRGQLSIDDSVQIQRYFEKSLPDVCINCAAYTLVDKAETEKERAFLINADGVGWLAENCAAFNTKFIHISTDYVFDGTSAIPLREDDPVSPINVYGASKLAGEELAIRNNPSTLIIRTAWVYSAFGNNFVKTMIRLMGEKTSVNVIEDQVGSPTWAADLARVILSIVESPQFIPGIFNYSNDGRISWFEFASAIKELVHSDCEVKPIPTSGYPTAAKRPAFSLLDKTKIARIYGITIPGWKQSLERCIQEISKKD